MNTVIKPPPNFRTSINNSTVIVSLIMRLTVIKVLDSLNMPRNAPFDVYKFIVHGGGGSPTPLHDSLSTTQPIKGVRPVYGVMKLKSI